MQRQLPLIYLHGIVPGRYMASWPVYIVVLALEQVTADDVREVVRGVLRQCDVPFTDIDVTSGPSAWKVIVHDENGMIF